MSNSAEVHFRMDSSTSQEVTWTMKDFSNLQEDVITSEYKYADFFCRISVDKSNEGSIKFSVVCKCRNAANPFLHCRLFLKTNEGTLHELLIGESGYYHITEEVTILSCEIPRTDSVDGKAFFVSEGVMTVVCKMSAEKTNPQEAATHSVSETGANIKREPSKDIMVMQKAEKTFLDFGNLLGVREGNPADTRYGKLLIHIDVMELTWTLCDFFNLPYGHGKGILSDSFHFPGGEAHVGLHVHESQDQEKSDLIRFVVFYLCPPGRGMRNPELDCEVVLVAADGSLCSSLVNEDSENHKEIGGYFYRYFHRSEIVRKSESLVPGGVLTVRIKLSRREDVGKESESG